MRKRKTSFIIAGCLVIASLSVMSSIILRNRHAHWLSKQTIDSKIIAANNNFGFDIFKEILKHETGNVFISPTSIAIAYEMTCNGAAGDTKDAMMQTMHVQGMSLDSLNNASRTLTAVLESADPKVKVSVANSLWLRRSGGHPINFKRDFLNQTRTWYDAEVTSLDFNALNAPDIINDWVSDKTRGKITSMVDRATVSASVIILLNAVYFKGEWSEPFDKSLTRDDKFTLADGTSKMIPMMWKSGDFQYFQGKGFQAVSLPYGSKRMSMYIFLPDEGSDLKEFYRNLNMAEWKRWMNGFMEWHGKLALPRFKVEYKTELDSLLTALGMGIAFGEGADFSNMISDANFFISGSLHKAYLEVNEEGTEAATSTSVPTAGMPAGPFEMIVDRPFFCAIRDNSSGAILFMGSVVDPQE